ncbi:phage protein Gp36 family protein [Spirosoma lituiforme]
MFLTKADLDSSLYPEISSMISRYSDAIINMNLVAAEGEIDMYLAARYAIRTELDKTGENRHAYLLTIARDLAIYHLYSLQETIPAHREKRYEQAITLLKLIQQGKSTLPGVDPAPVADAPDAASQIGYGGNARRPTLLNPMVGPGRYN